MSGTECLSGETKGRHFRGVDGEDGGEGCGSGTLRNPPDHITPGRGEEVAAATRNCCWQEKEKEKEKVLNKDPDTVVFFLFSSSLTHSVYSPCPFLSSPSLRRLTYAHTHTLLPRCISSCFSTSSSPFPHCSGSSLPSLSHCNTFLFENWVPV